MYGAPFISFSIFKLSFKKVLFVIIKINVIARGGFRGGRAGRAGRAHLLKFAKHMLYNVN